MEMQMDAPAVADGSPVRYLTIEERIEKNRVRDAMADEIMTLAGQLNAATYRLLKLIADFDRINEWHDNPNACSQWLNLMCGIDMNTAREKVRTARALEKLPLVSAAMERGEISYSKVRALTRVACPQIEQQLLDIALHSTASQLETVVRQYRNAQEAAELSREQQQQANRYLKYRYAEDGSFILSASVPAELGAMLLRALDSAVEELPPIDVSCMVRPALARRKTRLLILDRLHSC